MGIYAFTINATGNAKVELDKINASLVQFGAKVKEVETVNSTAWARMTGGIKNFAKEFGSLVGMGLGLSAGFLGIELVHKGVEYYRHLQEASTDLNQTLITMGGAANISEKELHKMAKALDETTVFEEAAILKSEAFLATFGQIKGEQFKSAMESITDYASKFFHGDLQEATKSLGIALDDPIKGIGRLHRTGVDFTDEQKKQIKHLQEQGKLMDAQNIVLKEIKRETGGQAARFAGTDEGKIKQQEKSWDAVYEKVGRIVSRLEVGLSPIISKIADGVLRVIDFVSKLYHGIITLFTSASVPARIFRTVLVSIIGAFAAFYAWQGLLIARMAVIRVATAAWAVIQGILSGAITITTIATQVWNAVLNMNPIVRVITLIALLIGAIAMLWDKFKGFREFVGGVWGFLSGQVKAFLGAIGSVARVISDLFHGEFTKAWEDTKDGFKQFGKDIVESTVAGMKSAENSTFKFGDLLKFGSGGQVGPSIPGFSDSLGKGGGGNLKKNAFDTSDLGGAKGGLGEAKIINIKIDTVQRVVANKGVDIEGHAGKAAEYLVRTLNNIAYSQSQSQ